MGIYIFSCVYVCMSLHWTECIDLCLHIILICMETFSLRPFVCVRVRKEKSVFRIVIYICRLLCVRMYASRCVCLYSKR